MTQTYLQRICAWLSTCARARTGTTPGAAGRRAVGPAGRFRS